MCMSSTKRRIGRFHVVVVQLVRYKAFLVSSHNAPPRYDTKNGWLWCSGRQRNVLKSVMHVQSCCFAHKTIFLEVVVFVVLSSLFAAFRRRNPGDVKCLGRGGGVGMRDGHVCIYLSNKEQSLYRIYTLFMISSLDEIKLQLLQQQKLCDEPFNFLHSNHARVMQPLSFFCYKSV